jgi:hypothetical protein
MQDVDLKRYRFRKLGENGLAEAQHAAFYLVATHWVLTLLAGIPAALSIMAAQDTGPGELVGAILHAGLVLVSMALVAVFGLGVLVGLALLWMRRQMERRKNYAACLTLCTLAMLVVPHGTWLGLEARRALRRPEVEALFDENQQEELPAPGGGGAGVSPSYRER